MLPLFDLHLPTLTLVVCVVLFTAASTMTLVGRTQRTYLGYGWWTTAQWLNTAGAICLVLKEHHPWLLPVSVLLTLQWPLTMLGGLRQFYIRSDFRTAAWVDLAVLTFGGGAYMAMWMPSPDDVGARVASRPIRDTLPRDCVRNPCCLFLIYTCQPSRSWCAWCCSRPPPP